MFTYTTTSTTTALHLMSAALSLKNNIYTLWMLLSADDHAWLLYRRAGAGAGRVRHTYPKNTGTSINTPFVQTAVDAPTELIFRVVPARNQGTHLLHHRALQHRSRRQGDHNHHRSQLSRATCSPAIHNSPLHRMTSLQLLFDLNPVLCRIRQSLRSCVYFPSDSDIMFFHHPSATSGYSSS